MNINFTYYRASDSKLKNALAYLGFRRKIIEVTQAHSVEGFTLIKCLGAWQGKTEPSYQMSLVQIDETVALNLAVGLKDLWRQDSVMVTKDNGEVIFL